MVFCGMRDRVTRRADLVRRRGFERLVRRALDALPVDVSAMLDNVEVVVEDEPTAEQIGRRASNTETLFGLYEGVPLTERGSGYSLVLPDKITIFRGPLERAFGSPVEVAREVRITVVHELGHHLGFEEDRLAELGLS